ncbi:MAG: hypothetical protein H6Q55_751 [Deltaproteobacteria bacterium]|nr:hypothetical protein [Deltaproteobacteria bacterium]
MSESPRPAEASSGLHILQIGYDDSVFESGNGSDTIERQKAYWREIDRVRPGSSLTLIVITKKSQAKDFRAGEVCFVPVLRTAKYLLPFSLFRTLARIHRSSPIHVIATQTVQEEAWVSAVFARLNGLRVIGQVHYDLFSPAAQREIFGQGLAGSLRKRLTFWVLPRLYAVRVVAKGIRDEVVKQNLNRNVSVIPVPVPMLRSEAPQSARDAPESPTILFVGRLVPSKRLDTWLQVAARVAAMDPRVRFEIVGDGPLKASLVDQAARLGLTENVTFRGTLPYAALPDAYRASTLFLLTSAHEGFGRVAVEAYAQQVPVVATRTVGSQDIVVHGETGFLHEEGDIAGIAESVMTLIRDDGLRRRMATGGNAFVRREFDPDEVSRHWSLLLANTAEEVKPRFILPPLRATWKRWQKLSSTRYSLLRALEYERLQGLRLQGRVLDAGGGASSSYHQLLTVDGTIDGVNLSANEKPAIVADLNRPLPVTSNSYDHVLSFNTLEHVEHDTKAVDELLRVLRPGGTFHIAIPFFHHAHASPSDFHRHTAEWWANTLGSRPVAKDSLKVEPLVWSPMASAYSVLEFSLPFRWLLRKLVMLQAMVSQAFWARGSDRLPENLFSGRYRAYALGFYVTGRKLSGIDEVATAGQG